MLKTPAGVVFSSYEVDKAANTQAAKPLRLWVHRSSILWLSMFCLLSEKMHREKYNYVLRFWKSHANCMLTGMSEMPNEENQKCAPECCDDCRLFWPLGAVSEHPKVNAFPLSGIAILLTGDFTRPTQARHVYMSCGP